MHGRQPAMYSPFFIPEECISALLSTFPTYESVSDRSKWFLRRVWRRLCARTTPCRIARIAVAVSRHHRKSRISGRVPHLVARLRRSPESFVSCSPLERKIWVQTLPQARRPQPHRCAQNQQCPRADSHRPPHGQTAHRGRDRCRPARGGHRHGLCLDGHGVHRLYGGA